MRESYGLICKGHGISLKTLLPQDVKNYSSAIDINIYNDILQTDFSLDQIPENLMPILTYIAGFNVRKELRMNNCDICIAWLQTDKEVEIETLNIPTGLILELDRGKLILPTEWSLIATSAVWFTLQKILDSFSEIFLSTLHQLSILRKISSIILSECFLNIETFSEECLCKKTLQSKLESITFRTCKIMLNNLVKNKNNDHNDHKSIARKIKKLKPN